MRLTGLLGMALAWLGWPQFVIAGYATGILAAASGVASAIYQRRVTLELSFGPCLLAGSLIGVLVPGTYT